MAREKREGPVKVAVLGGGVGALAAVLELTDPENPRHESYEITVYQMGWRLGGKGASGRNRHHQYRIEEHGLHIWFGCYDNAFQLIRKCYKELDRPPDAPLATWREAFKPHSEIVLKEQLNGRWGNWLGGLPTNDLIPGDPGALLPLWDYAILAIKMMLDRFAQSHHARPSPTGEEDLHLDRGVRRALDDWASQAETELVNEGLKLLHAAHTMAHHLRDHRRKTRRLMRKHAGGLAGWLGREVRAFQDALKSDLHGATHALIVKTLGVFMEWLWKRLEGRVKEEDEARHLWILANFIYANLRGGIEAGILVKGFDSINECDYRDWLRGYAYDDGDLMLNSAWMRGTYDAMFAYVDGDNRIPEGQAWPPKARLEAGTTMRAGIRQFLAYKGASVWKMQAGMGDTVFAPIYEVLKRRGVRFEFFHRVRQVEPDAKGEWVERIRLTRQVELTERQKAVGGYDPLIDVKGLPCWPSEPDYDQLAQGKELHARGVNLEAYNAPWEDVADVTLQRGVDFDLVVMGISVGAFPYVCGDLIRASRKWKAMVDNVKTIRTQALQLWLKPTAYELGWTLMGRPIVTAFEVTPLNTWADMSHLIPREGWPVSAYPLNLAYFTGPMRDSRPAPTTGEGPIEPESSLDQAAANDQVCENALALLNDHLGEFCMPGAQRREGQGRKAFRWELLVDPGGEGREGPSRFQSGYWHANVMPSERYVISAPGSSKYRLPPHDPEEFANLYLAGDWTDNGFNLGCVEAASMSGRLAAHALSGYPRREDIIGLDL